MKRNFLTKLLTKVVTPALFLGTMFSQQSCLDAYAPGNYYTFTGETVANFLENREETFSDFIYCLKQANIWGEMRTYGEYTCFAPTNDAFDIFLQDKGLSSVEGLTKEECDTIAFTHIIKNLFYCSDIVEGAMPFPNMLDRYLIYTCDSLGSTGEMGIYYKINSDATILERDDTVTNGVMQIVDRVIAPSNKFLPDVMKLDERITIFYEALMKTHMNDSLVAYLDYNYRSPGYDSISLDNGGGIPYDTGYETCKGLFPEKRYFKFTAFAEPDSVYKANNINNLDDLIAFAKEVYDKSYPEDANKYDDDFTNRKNPLNRFVSYHLLPEQLNYNEFNVSDDWVANQYVSWKEQDLEDFYETMMPYSIMRISNPYNSQYKYINRKGTAALKNLTFEGARIKSTAESGRDQTALNGVYHLLDNIIAFDYDTRYQVLNTRIRVMCNTMSPDFINSGARGPQPVSTTLDVTMGFIPGFCKNVQATAETQCWVRKRNSSYTSYFGDEMTIRGIYDITFRLPPVPTSGTYELRFYECTLAGTGKCDRGVVQFYLNGAPCGIPVDLRLQGDNPLVGRIGDSDAGSEDAIRANDKAMRNRGYMKAMDSYTASGGDNLRGRQDCIRKIVTTDYFYNDQDYYLRLRLVLDNPNACCPFNTIELVPKSVYAGDIPEDRH